MLNGSCHCGAVQYRVKKVATPFGHCHCQTCRKTHSASFTTTARVAREDFEWLQGEDILSAYESSPGKRRLFCGVCGCHIVAIRNEQEQLILRVATLDDDPGLRPQFHIWRSHDKPWLESPDGLPSHQTWPPDRT